MSKLFSRIFIEEQVRDHPRSIELLSRTQPREIVAVESYKQVFNRRGQEWLLQKREPALILAKKQLPLVYPVKDFVAPIAGRKSYYVTPILNCLYDCEYCFLRGMYSGAHVVLFVNQEEIIREVADLTAASISISYETDLLPFEGLFQLLPLWTEAALQSSHLEFECRTKSAAKLKNVDPVSNFVLTWTLSPEKIATRLEHGTPSLRARVKAALSAAEQGWRVRLAIDPILYVEDWKHLYENFVREISPVLAVVEDISIGSFRINSSYLGQARKKGLGFFFQNFSTENSYSSYPSQIEEEIISVVRGMLATATDERKIRVYN